MFKTKSVDEMGGFMKYTLSSYEPISMVLPKPQVPKDLVDTQIEKMLEPFAEYHEIDEERPVKTGDFVVITTQDSRIDGNLAKHFILTNSLYHVGAGEMPKTFDDAILGMQVGETRDVKAMIKMPIGNKNDLSLLTMRASISKILYCVTPKLTDEFVAEHFDPCKTIEEFRNSVTAQFGKPDMSKDDPNFPDLVLDELAKRLVEEPDPADGLPGMPKEALTITCAIDALADHLNLELDDDQITAQMPGESIEQRKKVRKQLEDQGMSEQAYVFARREAALSWLVNNSRISYK